MCCCQANNVHKYCLGDCMNPFAKEYLHNVTETKKNDLMRGTYTVSVISEVLIREQYRKILHTVLGWQ